jgi:predicted transcriptional regulator
MTDSASDAAGACADLKNARRVLATNPDRLLPHSIEAEAGVLGCVLLSPLEYTRSLLSDLKSDSFYSLQNRIVFDAIATMHREKQAIDVITLQQRLRDAGLLEQIGGIAYLAKLQDDVPSAANWDYYRDIVLEKYQLRKIAQTCTEIVSRVYDSTCTVDELRFSAQSDLGEVFGKNGGGLPDIVDATNFLKVPLPAAEQIVEGLLHKGSKLSLGGSSKAYKTWLLAGLGIAVASGTDWMGFHTIKGKVLYLNFEIQPSPWQSRLTSICKAKGIELEPDMFQLWNLRGYGADFRSLIPKIIERAQSEGYSLIILDPIYKLYGGTDENAAGDVAALLNALEHLAVETGAAIVYGSHFAKGNASAKEALDRISGSGVFARDPDSLIIFTAHEEPDAFTVELILRNFTPIEPFVVRWNFPLMERDCDLDPNSLKQVAGRRREHDPKLLLAAIQDNNESNPISLSEWARLADIPRKTLADYLPDLRSKGFIITIGQGTTSKQAITQKGTLILNP